VLPNDTYTLCLNDGKGSTSLTPVAVSGARWLKKEKNVEGNHQSLRSRLTHQEKSVRGMIARSENEKAIQDKGIHLLSYNAKRIEASESEE